MSTRSLKYWIKTAEYEGPIQFIVYPPHGKEKPERIYITLPERARSSGDSGSLTVPKDALVEFLRRHDATRPYDEELREQAERVLKDLVEKTKDAPTIRTDHALYRELVRLGSDQAMTAVLLSLLDENSFEDRRILYCTSVLYDLVPEGPDQETWKKDARDLRMAWLRWGAEQSLAW